MAKIGFVAAKANDRNNPWARPTFAWPIFFL